MKNTVTLRKLRAMLSFGALLGACTFAQALGIGRFLGLPFELGATLKTVEKAGFKCVPMQEARVYEILGGQSEDRDNTILRSLQDKYLSECSGGIIIPGIASPQRVTFMIDAISGKVESIESRFPGRRDAFELLIDRWKALGGPPLKFEKTSDPLLQAGECTVESTSEAWSADNVEISFNRIVGKGRCLKAGVSFEEISGSIRSR